MTVPYNPDATVDLQPDDWSCSEQSAQWLLRSIGRQPHDNWIRPALLNEGIVTDELGLMDASGRQLSSWLQREYGDEMGLHFRAINPVSWEDLAQIAGARPVLIGGRGWNHWSGVRRVVDGGLELANPAPNWQGVGNVLDRAEFDALGSWSAITVYSDQEVSAPPPEPEPEPDPKEVVLSRVRALLTEAVELLKGVE